MTLSSDAREKDSNDGGGGGGGTKEGSEGGREFWGPTGAVVRAGMGNVNEVGVEFVNGGAGYPTGTSPSGRVL